MLKSTESSLQFSENFLIKFGLTNDYLNKIYEEGKENYLAGRNDEALISFMSLVVFCPGDRRFQFALGLALHHAGQYQDAIKYYFASIALFPYDPRPVAGAAHCFLALDRHDEARELLQVAIAQSFNDESYEEVRLICSNTLDKLVK